jgi:hypothetical protein
MVRGCRSACGLTAGKGMRLIKSGKPLPTRQGLGWSGVAPKITISRSRINKLHVAKVNSSRDGFLEENRGKYPIG